MILGGPAATFELYDAQFFEKFRDQNLVRAAIEYAQVISAFLVSAIQALFIQL